MILNDNQSVNVVVRGIIIEEDQLVVTEWLNKSWSFLLGGRVDFGEHIIDALHREMKEEAGVAVQIQKLAYFSENMFIRGDGREQHEYGYYFLVKPERLICPDGVILPNPDDKELIIRRAPITDEGLNNIWPRFLPRFLPQDMDDQFAHCPRFLFSHYSAADGRHDTIQSVALAHAFGHDNS